MYRQQSRDHQTRRSVSPRPESKFRNVSRSPVSEGHPGGRNGHQSMSRSLSRTQSPSRSRSRGRSRSWSRSPVSRSYRDRSYGRSESPPGNAGTSSKIIIEKLTKNVTEPHLLEIFGDFGEIQSVDLPMNHAFMTNRGTAYILYSDPADAEAAIAHMHEAQLDGAVLNVSIVLPKRAFSRSPPPVSNTRSNFGRQRHFPGRHSDNRPSHHSSYQQRASPPRRYGRSRPVDRHDVYRPRSLSRSRSRSTRRSRSLSSPSPSASPPRNRARGRNESPRRGRRRSPSYSSYDYSSRSRSRSYTMDRERIHRGPERI
ncbi:hypothetical protein BDV19DRAFT_41414 [Aspergillus venezuelensis]